jgi:hypothetical protein
VEDTLLTLLARNPRIANEAIESYGNLLQLLTPESVALPPKEDVHRHRYLIRHQQVASRTQLKIVTPPEFIEALKLLA